jgi:hypothetical protein
MTEAVNEYLKCLEEERFYDAHEVLEDLWFPKRFEKSDDVLLLKGLINAAVSFELIKRGRPGPSEKPWDTYVKYKACYDGVRENREHFKRLIDAVDALRSQYV